jgi:heme exporter protein C
MTTRTRTTAAERTERGLGVAAAVSGAAAAVLALVVAPPDAVQGQAQRLMYVHVPAAWAAYLAFGVVAVASVAYLVRRDLRYDSAAQAAAELGVGLTALAIVLGSLWARPTWGTFWTWDPRLVSTAVLLLVYVGYLGVRGLATDPHANARRAAVLGVLAVVTVPVVHFSVVWWRALHQPPSVLRPGGPAGTVPTVMLVTLLAGVLAFTLASAWVWLRRIRMLTPAFDRAAAPAGAPEIVVSRREGA